MKLKIMTYNIHSGKDINDRYSLHRIATTIKESKADLIGMNEVIQNLMSFVKIYPEWSINQAGWLAREFDGFYRFGRNLRLGMMNYFGNAIITKYPITKSKNYLLRGKKEQRGCLQVEVKTPKGVICLLVVHLGLSKFDRQVQIEDINKIFDQYDGPKILMGDLNTTNKEELVALESKLINIQIDETSEVQGTFPGNNPKKKIDYLFCSKEFKIIKSFPILSDASDHLPLYAELKL